MRDAWVGRPGRSAVKAIGKAGHVPPSTASNDGKRRWIDGLARNYAALATNDRKQESTPMQIASASAGTPKQPPRDMLAGEAGSATAPSADPRFAQYKVIRRNGAVVGFEPAKISIAMTKAFLAVNGAQGAASARGRELVATLPEAEI